MADIVQLEENGVKKYLKTHVKAVDGLDTELVALKQLSSDQFDIQVSTSSSIVVVPKWDCYIEVQSQFNGWGYAGKKWTVQIKPPQGITTILNGTGVVEGGDIISKNVCFSSIFSNLKKGVSYTFARNTLEGSAGGANDTAMIAKLYRTT